MNIKEDVDFVAKSLSGDEKVLENAFKLETLYKKHKIKIWLIVITLIAFFVTKAVMDELHHSKLVKANEAFLSLQIKADDAKSIKILKENNPALFELFSYSEAVKAQDSKTLKSLSSSKNTVIADASKYTASVLDKKVVDSKLYNDMSIYVGGYLSLIAGEKKDAKNSLSLIDERSPLAVVTGFLKHSTIKDK